MDITEKQRYDLNNRNVASQNVRLGDIFLNESGTQLTEKQKYDLNNDNVVAQEIQFGNIVNAIATGDTSSLQDLTDEQIEKLNNIDAAFKEVQMGTMTQEIIEGGGGQYWDVVLYSDPDDGGTVSGEGRYADGETATITAVPVEGYSFLHWVNAYTAEQIPMPEYSFTVSEFNRSFTAVFQQGEPEPPYIRFECDTAFTLATRNNATNWDGIIEVNTGNPTEPSDWNIWDGTQAVSSSYSSSSGKDIIYVRGSENTYITNTYMNTKQWVLEPLNQIDLISMYGNIENLLDYAMVSNGQHPPMADYCFGRLFGDSSYINTSLALRGTLLVTGCYQNLYRASVNIETISALPAVNLPNSCYSQLYSGCSKIKISTTQDYEYQYEYRIPDGTATGTMAGAQSVRGMFNGTGGTVIGDPSINTTYYTANEIVR